MATAINLYCIGNMEKAVVLSATPTEATGFPKENLITFNPDLYCKPTSTANQAYVIDFGTAQLVDRWAVLVHNYTTNFITGSASIRVSYSSDNITYTTWETKLIFSTARLQLSSTSLTPQTYRYWKIELLSMSAIMEISGIFLARIYTLRANQYPEKDQTVYYNRTARAAGGRMFVTGITRTAVRLFPRTWLFPSTTDMQPLIDAHANCRGSLFPLVYQETTGIDTTLVRFAEDELKQNKIAHQIYNPTVEFEELPHIYPGEAL